MWRALSVPLVFALLLVSNPSSAAVPLLLPHQGFLTDGTDTPVDGTVEMRFGLFKQAQPDGDTNDPAWWEAEALEVKVVRGFYAVVLGHAASGTGPLPVDAFSEPGERWLGVEVNGVELFPRLRIGATPYAFVAGRALTAEEAGHSKRADEATRADHAGSADEAALADKATDAEALSGLSLAELDQRWLLRADEDLTVTGTIAAGRFEGDGAALTNLTLPSNVARVDEAQTFSKTQTFADARGTFSGDGAGLTNLTLPANLARLDETQTFTQPSVFAAGLSADGGLSVGESGLTVAGGIRVGTTQAACGAATEGSVRYDAATKMLQFCDGLGWRPVTGDPLGAPTFDTGWFDISKDCNAYEFPTGGTGLPRLITGYYRRENGEILAYGLNQYGDSHQANGAILGYDESSDEVYLRLPCGNQTNNVLHLGNYRTRKSTANENISNQTGLKFRIRLWH